MNSTQRKLELRSDIQKMIDAIDDEIDAFIVKGDQKEKPKRELAEIIFKSKQKKRVELASYMSKKYDK